MDVAEDRWGASLIHVLYHHHAPLLTSSSLHICLLRLWELLWPAARSARNWRHARVVLTSAGKWL